MSDSVRAAVEDVLSRDMTREIWSGNYDKALPFSLYHFELSAILPAVFYMFRFGQRRGAGRFLKTFGQPTGTPSQKRRSATIERIQETLADTKELVGFDEETERAILGDLLLCFCLENYKHSLGRNQQVQRAAPAHYMASWVDLPQSVAHLRHIPEMIVAILAAQKGDHVEPSQDGVKTPFAVGKDYKDNVLLRAFSQGIIRRGNMGDLASDRFDEGDGTVGLDQLLMIRLAQQLHAAPDKIRGKGSGPISNQRPIAETASRHFSDDIRRFLRVYAVLAPRHTLVEMLESCIAIGLTTILTSTVEMLFRWADTGEVPSRTEQPPAHLLVDCSSGVERRIRDLAEQSMDDLMRRMERFPMILMILRLLDYEARDNRKIRKQVSPGRPYATEWLNLLGDLLHGQHSEAQRIHFAIEDKAEKLARKLAIEHPEVQEVLTNVDGQESPAWRLAEGLRILMGPNFGRRKFMQMVDSCLLTGRPNGLASKRTTTHGIRVGERVTRRRRDLRSLVFTDSVLEYLVHLHLLRSGNKPGTRALSFKEFIHTLRDRYGFHVDTAPAGMTISNALLQENRAVLERRLRDLGLLVGVNDAEAMKRLRPRFEPVEEH